MKKLFCKIVYIFLISVLFLSCKNIFNSSNENPVDEKSAYLCITDSQVHSRTINPGIKLSDFSFFELSGRFSTGDEKVLGTWTSYSDFTNSKVNVAIGVWDFYLKAQTEENSKTVYKGKLLNKNITNGANSISFDLYPFTYSMSDRGAFDITVKIPSGIVTNAVCYLELFNEPLSNASFAEAAIDVTPHGEHEEKDSLVYTGTEITSGVYNAVIVLYRDDVELNTVTSIVNIVDGFVSSGIIDIDDIENIYTISYEIDDAMWNNPGVIPTVYSRKTEVLLPSPENIYLDGYTFGGWYTSPVAKETPATLGQRTPFEGSITSVSKGNTGNKTFYAFFTLNSYPVLFMPNGGSGSMGVQEFAYTVSKTLNANKFTRTGYHFKNWNTSPDGSGTSYSDKASLTMPLNGITLYAIWEANTYYVSFDPNGGTGNVMQPQTMTYDKPAALNANTYTRTGYRFTGWSTTANGDVSYADKATVINLTSANTGSFYLYAQWAYHLNVGDIVLKDGSIRQKSNNPNLSNAVAVIFKATTETEPALGIAILSDEMQNRTYKWAKNTNTNFSTIGDGSANWGIICETDPEGTLDAQTNYPAFYAVNNFANLQDTGIYTYGWYIPSTAEAQMIFDQFAENENFLSDRMDFWTSSSKTKAEAYYAYHEYDDGWNYDTSYTNKTGTCCILPVRAFGEEYNIDYQFNGGFAPENFPLKHTAGSATSLARPIRYGFKFEGWYTDFAFTNPIYYIPSDASSITLYAKWTACLSVGDVILKDGTVILYNKVNAMTNEQKKNAVAVIFKANEGDTPAFGVGLKTDYLKWSSNTNNNFATSDTDGRLNWKVIREADAAGAVAPDKNYPVFNYAQNYSSKYDTGIYNGDWYIPSKDEASTIADLYSSGGTFYQASCTVGLDLADVSFWTSSNKNNASAWSYGISYDSEDDSMAAYENYSNKTSPCDTLVIRTFGIAHKITYVLNGGTLADGAPTEHMYGSETQVLPPVERLGYTFDGWYTNSSFSGNQKYYIEPEETEVALYAKWEVGPLDFSKHRIEGFFMWLLENIDTTTTDNAVIVKGPLNHSEFILFSIYLESYKRRIGYIDLSELEVTDFYIFLDAGSFQNFSVLKQVVLPRTLKTLNANTFANCALLEKVTMNEGLKTISYSAFAHCPKLKSITIPDSVVFIDQTAFSRCYDLEEVIISKNSQLQTIGPEVFGNCTSLKSFYIPPKVISLNNLASEYSRIFNREYNSSNHGAFYNCTSLKSVQFENTLIRINEYTFEGCTALTDVYYTGTEEEWNKIEIRTGNPALLSATKHFNWTE